MANLIIQENGVARTRPAVNGEEITIKTPCSCSDVTGVQINGVAFPFYDALGKSLASVTGLFAKNSLIRVLIDTDNTRAYILNRGITAADVGALPIDGGTLTGMTLGLRSGRAVIEAYPGNLDISSRRTAGDSSNQFMLRLNNDAVRSRALMLYQTENGEESEYSIYGTHNKPTAADVGAVSKSGDTMTNTLYLQSSSVHIRAKEAGGFRYHFDLHSNDGTKRLGGLAFSGSNGVLSGLYLTFGETGDDASQGLAVSPTNLKFLNNTVFHAGNKADYVSFKTTATIPSDGWTVNGDGYAKTVSITGILGADTPIIGPVLNAGTTAGLELIKEEWGKIVCASTIAGGITFYCSEIPTVNIPIQITCVR